ncbi:MAG: DinB family protein [Saprospiraceae bacterium]
MKKAAIIQGLQTNFGTLFHVLETLPEGQLSQPLAPGKWSIGQHAKHLLLSTQPVTKGMQLPKPALLNAFGTRSERPEQSEEELVKVYLGALAGGVKAPPKFTPEEVTEAQKANLVADLKQELNDLTSTVDQWDETDLSEYVMPHPALGALTIREMLMFTVYHTQHHTLAMQGKEQSFAKPE